MKLFTRKGIVTLGATVAIATTGIVAPANAEEGTTAPETGVVNEEKDPASTDADNGNSEAGTPKKDESTTDETATDPNAGVTNSSEYDCAAEAAKPKSEQKATILNSLQCKWEGGFDNQLGIITGFATLITTVIGVASAVFSLVKKVAPELF